MNGRFDAKFLRIIRIRKPGTLQRGLDRAPGINIFRQYYGCSIERKVHPVGLR
jgi:hypothetical protein